MKEHADTPDNALRLNAHLMELYSLIDKGANASSSIEQAIKTEVPEGNLAPKEELAETKADEAAAAAAVSPTHEAELDEDGLPDFVERKDMHIDETPKAAEEGAATHEAKQATMLKCTQAIAMDETEGPKAEAKRAAEGGAGSSTGPADTLQESASGAVAGGAGSDPKKFRGELDADVSDASKVEVSG